MKTKILFLMCLIFIFCDSTHAQDKFKSQGLIKGQMQTIKPTDITLNYMSLYLFIGDKPKLVATVLPATAHNKTVIWTSLNPDVASVDANGNLTVKGEGTTKIRATTQEGRLTAECSIEVDPTNKYGNMSGNVANGGYVSSQGNWVYYANPYDGMKLYKIRKDGTMKTKLCDDRVSNINVMGHVAYYVNKSSKGTLYWINTQDKRKGCLNDVDQNIDNLFGYGTWLYYLTGDRSIYLIAINGNNRGKLSDVKEVNRFTLADDWIYFRNASGLSKMRKNGGTDKKSITLAPWSYPVWDQNSVYFIMGGSLDFFRYVNNDLKHYRNILAEKPFNVAKDWIYYRSRKDPHYLRKIHVSGTLDQVLVERSDVKAIFVAGDWLYYYTGDDNGFRDLFKIRTDGLHNEKVN
jgi:hypothetical protein